MNYSEIEKGVKENKYINDFPMKTDINSQLSQIDKIKEKISKDFNDTLNKFVEDIKKLKIFITLVN